jgi:ubiquinone/menaquinone biosynthesis C-methylase UbiE
MFLSPFRRRDNPHMLVVGMVGVKMGERFAQVGCAHGGRLAAVAANAGLSGRAVAFVPDDQSAERARKGAAGAGVLLEVEVTPPTRLPAEDGSFDVVVVDDAGGLMAAMRPEDRAQMVREAARILRPGGRVMAISRAPRGGLGALLTRAESGPPFDALPWLQADGFRAVRRLAEREGLVFVDGIKPRV